MVVAVFFCVKYRLNHFTGKITQTQVLHAFDKALQDCRKNAAKFFMGILRSNFAKIYDYIFAKFKIISSKFCVSRNFKMLLRSHPSLFCSNCLAVNSGEGKFYLLLTNDFFFVSLSILATCYKQESAKKERSAHL